MMAIVPLLQSLKENNQDFFSRDTVSYLVNSKEGVMMRSFMNYVGPATYRKISRTDCPENIHSGIQREQINFDPRCRPWFTHTIQFIRNYAKLINQVVINKQNLRYPVITVDHYDDIDATLVNQFTTYCTVDEFDTSKTILQNDFYVICQDYPLELIFELASRSFANSIVNVLEYLSEEPRAKALVEQFRKIPVALDMVNKPYIS